MNSNYLESPTDSTLQEDLEYIANSGIAVEELKGATVLVTGATGLVGSALVKSLACCNRIHKLDMQILGLIRNEEKAKLVFGDLLNRGDVKVVVGDVQQKLNISGNIDYIIHGASVTASKSFVTNPTGTIQTALQGTTNLLEFAKEKNVRSIVYISSMEAFGITDSAKQEIKEEDLGYIDVMNVRSCYSESKRMCEVICTAYAHEYKIPVKVARLAQTFGAGVSKEEGRVFAQFAKSALRREHIVLHTKGESTGNYCYTADAVTGLLTVLLKGESGNVYTVANSGTTIKIKDMAEMVAKHIAKGDIEVIFDIPEDALTYGYAPDVCMHLNSDKLQKLGWSPKYDLPEMYERLCQSFINQGFDS